MNYTLRNVRALYNKTYQAVIVSFFNNWYTMTITDLANLLEMKAKSSLLMLIKLEAAVKYQQQSQ